MTVMGTTLASEAGDPPKDKKKLGVLDRYLCVGRIKSEKLVEERLM